MLNSKNFLKKQLIAKTNKVKIIECKTSPKLNGLIIDSVKITSNKKQRTRTTNKKASKLDLILNKLQSIDCRLDSLESDMGSVKVILKRNNLN